MDEKKQRLVIEGNAFYELDLECLKKKKEGRPQGQKGEGKAAEHSCTAQKRQRD